MGADVNLYDGQRIPFERIDMLLKHLYQGYGRV